MSKKRRLEWSFFLNDRSRVTYNELCRRCRRDCKQSFRAVVIECPKYLSKRSRKGAEKKRENGAEPETAEIPLEQRAHFYTGGKPCMCALRGRQPGQSNVRAFLRCVAPYKGVPPLRCHGSYPSALCSGNSLLAQSIFTAKPENSISSRRPSTENVGGLFLSIYQSGG